MMMVITQIMMPVIIPTEKPPIAIGILHSSEETDPTVSELKKSIHVLIVIVFNGVGH